MAFQAIPLNVANVVVGLSSAIQALRAELLQAIGAGLRKKTSTRPRDPSFGQVLGCALHRAHTVQAFPVGVMQLTGDNAKRYDGAIGDSPV
jgi:hypothetical protein